MNKIKILLPVFILIFISSIFARPRVIEYPKVLVKKTDSIRIKWDNGIGAPVTVLDIMK